jgi:3-phenylpropionate/trans-cinnamate dioxygenase ferredoxin subunit
MGEFVKAAGKEEIPSGQGKTVEVGGHNVAVFNVDETFYAISGSCTHQGAPLSGGPVTANVVTCPWHGARFDITTGRALSPPASGGVTCYKVRITDDDIEIEV